MLQVINNIKLEEKVTGISANFTTLAIFVIKNFDLVETWHGRTV